MIQKTREFFREVKVELKKISWPMKKETIASTSVVLIIVLIVSFFLGFVDLGLSRMIKLILS
jgi:preprotein translocase subunit SecE